MEWTPFKHAAIGVLLAIVMLILMWLFSSESSPLYQFTLYNPSIGNAISFVNLPAVFLGIAASGNAHQPSVAATFLGIFVQWAILGYVASWVSSKLRGRALAEDASDA